MTEQINEEVEASRKLLEIALKERGPDFTLEQLIEQENHYQRGLKFVEESRWDEAIEAFEASIAMRDCMPQPWGNIGVARIMQGRYDEAEVALRRALAIDPHYAIAKRNLKLLPRTRREGVAGMAMHDPMKSPGVKSILSFLNR